MRGVIMKKIFKFCALLLSVALLLTACGSEEKTKVYTATSNNQEHVFTIYYKNIKIGYLEIDDSKLRLTRKGLFYGNEVFSEFLLD